MKCTTDVIITKIEAKTNKVGGNYLILTILDLKEGDIFEVVSKNMNLLKEVCQMEKRKNFILKFTPSKYGIKTEIVRIGDKAEL